ncbi:BT_2262 family domain-containing protein [Winogradskyella sp. PC D3.3]
MKKLKFKFYAFLILGLMLSSCDPSVDEPGSNDKSEITYLPLITLEGATSLELDCDTTLYTDPGAVASVAGNEIDLNTVTSGTYFGSDAINSPDLYNVSYSAFNSDGIPATAFREVLWPPCNGDLITSIAGIYTASLTRTPGYSTTDIGPILIKDLGNDVYAISDAIAGWYQYEYGYGADYAALGMTVTANDISANDFTHDDVIGVGAFGGALSMDSFSVNPNTGTIEFETTWSSGYVFEVTLTQIQ